MEAQSARQVLHAGAVDVDDRPLGRVVGTEPGPDRRWVEWLVMRLWSGGQLRAVPADDAQWIPSGIRVPYLRQLVAASPEISAHTLSSTERRADVQSFYAKVRT